MQGEHKDEARADVESISKLTSDKNNNILAALPVNGPGNSKSSSDQASAPVTNGPSDPTSSLSTNVQNGTQSLHHVPPMSNFNPRMMQAPGLNSPFVVPPHTNLIRGQPAPMAMPSHAPQMMPNMQLPTNLNGMTMQQREYFFRQYQMQQYRMMQSQQMAAMQQNLIQPGMSSFRPQVPMINPQMGVQPQQMFGINGPTGPSGSWPSSTINIQDQQYRMQPGVLPRGLRTPVQNISQSNQIAKNDESSFMDSLKQYYVASSNSGLIPSKSLMVGETQIHINKLYDLVVAAGGSEWVSSRGAWTSMLKKLQIECDTHELENVKSYYEKHIAPYEAYQSSLRALPKKTTTQLQRPNEPKKNARVEQSPSPVKEAPVDRRRVLVDSILRIQHPQSFPTSSISKQLSLNRIMHGIDVNCIDSALHNSSSPEGQELIGSLLSLKLLADNVHSMSLPKINAWICPIVKRLLDIDAEIVHGIVKDKHRPSIHLLYQSFYVISPFRPHSVLRISVSKILESLLSIPITLQLNQQILVYLVDCIIHADSMPLVVRSWASLDSLLQGPETLQIPNELKEALLDYAVRDIECEIRLARNANIYNLFGVIPEGINYDANELKKAIVLAIQGSQNFYKTISGHIFISLTAIYRMIVTQDVWDEPCIKLLGKLLTLLVEFVRLFYSHILRLVMLLSQLLSVLSEDGTGTGSEMRQWQDRLAHNPLFGLPDGGYIELCFMMMDQTVRILTDRSDLPELINWFSKGKVITEFFGLVDLFRELWKYDNSDKKTTTTLSTSQEPTKSGNILRLKLNMTTDIPQTLGAASLIGGFGTCSHASQPFFVIYRLLRIIQATLEGLDRETSYTYVRNNASTLSSYLSRWISDSDAGTTISVAKAKMELGSPFITGLCYDIMHFVLDAAFTRDSKDV